MRFLPANFALRSRAFGIFTAGSLTCQTGEWMTWVALNWTVLESTGSVLYLATINACRLVPAFLASVPAGVIADRSDRRRALISLYAGVALSTLCAGYLLAAGSSFWLLATVVTLRSFLMAAVIPVRNALIPNLVTEERVASAVAADTATRNLARIFGPALAGVMLAVAAVENVFWLGAGSFVLAILSLLLVRSQSDREATADNAAGGLREAVDYLRNSPSVQSLLILAVVPLIFAFPYTAMMPLFASELLRLGPEGLGVILSVAAVGALAGSAWLSFASESTGKGRWLIVSTVALGSFLVVFMFTETLVTGAVVIFFVGLASSVYRTTSRVALQTEVPDRLRGRVLSIALMDRGFMPLGALMIGAVAELAGALTAGVFMGLGCVVVTLVLVSVRRSIWNL